MAAWSSALAAEVSDWPRVEARSFFGFTALYYGERMFAALPRTRAWGTGNSLAFKIEDATPETAARLENDSRIGYALLGKNRWFTFELSSGADLRNAIEWLGRAYDAAARAFPKDAGKRSGSKENPTDII